MGCSRICAERAIYSRKKKNPQINHLRFYLKKPEKGKNKPKMSSRKEIIKLRVEINKIENRKIIEKITETKNCFFRKPTCRPDKLIYL